MLRIKTFTKNKPEENNDQAIAFGIDGSQMHPSERKHESFEVLYLQIIKAIMKIKVIRKRERNA